VSAGYLRFWTGDPGRHWIRYFSKDGSIDKVVGVRDVLHRRGFNSSFVGGAEDDNLEQFFATVEQSVLPIIGRIVDGGWEPEWQMEVKVLAALHLARSFRFRQMYEDLVDQWQTSPLAGMSPERLAAVFQRQYHRPPGAGELEQIVQEHVATWRRENFFYVNESGEALNKILKMFEGKYVQVVRVKTPGVEFVTGDCPLVVATLSAGGG